MTDKAILEAVARAVFEQEDANDANKDPGSATYGRWDEAPPHWKDDYSAMAQAAIDAYEAAQQPERIAPVQGYSAGIPWSMHLRAYDAYCKKCGPQEALIDLEGRNCRGGFGVEELDEFIPGWRKELAAQPDTHAIQAATAAERKRCAEIARAACRVSENSKTLDSAFGQVALAVSARIAEAIENPET